MFSYEFESGLLSFIDLDLRRFCRLHHVSLLPPPSFSLRLTKWCRSPVSSRAVTEFSPCSIGNICTALGSSLNTRCLGTPGAAGNPALISLRSCGNGILEAGEDCDPGNSEDPCCNRVSAPLLYSFIPRLMTSSTTGDLQIRSERRLLSHEFALLYDSVPTCSGRSALSTVDGCKMRRRRDVQRIFRSLSRRFSFQRWSVLPLR